MNNTNPVTGIPYGIIHSHNLHSEVVDDLMYGPQAIDHQLKFCEDEYRAEHELTEDDEIPQEFYDDYESYEPTIEGIYEGVHYMSSWLGGALHFFIMESPETGYYDPCSPCVPGAGNLDSGHGIGLKCYDVPKDWRNEVE